MPKGKRTPRLKGKTGRVDFIEDIIPTSEGEEIIRETYDERKKQWKWADYEKKQALDAWKEKYRQARENDLRNELESKTKIELLNQKMTWLLQQTLTAEAFEWLDSLREHDPACCNTIVRIIIDDEAMAAIDYIIRVVYAAGGPPADQRINLADLVKYWRKLKGIKSKIIVKDKDGNETSLSDYVRDSKDWRTEDD